MSAQTVCQSVCRVESVQQEFDITRPYMELDHDPVSGSAFLVAGSTTRILYTNFHVVEGNVDKRVLLFFPLLGKTPVHGMIKHVYPQSDLAVIEVGRKESKKIAHIENLELSYERVPKFSEAYALGFPLGCDDVQISEGVVSGWEDAHYHLNISINSGNSGGPILNSCQQVIAVSVATLVGAEAIGLGIPSVFIRDIVKIKSDSILCLEAESVGSVRGSIIMSLHKSDCLYKMGFRKGDVVCEICDEEVSAFGMLHVKWMDIPVHWTDKNLMRQLLRGGSAVVERGDEISDLTWGLIEGCIPSVRTVYPFYEDIPYMRMGDIVMVPFSLNLVPIAGHSLTKELASYAIDTNERHTQRAVISYIKTFSDLYISDRVELFDVVTHVNGKKVNTFEDVQKLVCARKRKRNVTLTLNDVINIKV